MEQNVTPTECCWVIDETKKTCFLCISLCHISYGFFFNVYHINIIKASKRNGKDAIAIFNLKLSTVRKTQQSISGLKVISYTLYIKSKMDFFLVFILKK